MKNRILITGGLGYLGGRVSRFLSQCSSFDLTLGIHKMTPTPDWLINGKLASIDLLESSSLEKACDGITHIVHFAALNEIDSAEDPERALLVNGLGSLKLLRAAIQAGAKRFLYFSTAHVYGSPLIGIFTEDTLPRPIHPYAISHRTAEDFVLASKDKEEIEGIVVRLSNGFGAPERIDVNRWTLLVNDLCKQAVFSKKLVLRSSGLQLRDFITLTDIGRAVQHLLTIPQKTFGNGIFNLGGENSMRIIEIAEKIADRSEIILGFRPEIQRPLPATDEQSSFLDYRITKLKQTGFSLSGNVNDEIDSTLRLCQSSFLDKN